MQIQEIRVLYTICMSPNEKEIMIRRAFVHVGVG